jgi:hypothetical protein
VDANTVTSEPCTTWSRRLRHFSLNLASARVGGREGTTLCDADAYDEENRNAWMASFGSTKRVTVADLPPCKKCVRKAGLPQ